MSPDTGSALVTVPSRLRPGMGRSPKSEGRRPQLPQHARFCLPLEAGSGLGWLVYPPLADHEAFQLRRTGAGEIEFAFFGGDPAAAQHLFTLRLHIPGSGLGVWSQDLSFRSPDCGLDDTGIVGLRDALLRMNSLWAPPGAVALRGNVDFRTPPGWDLVCTGVFNQSAPPRSFVFTARVQADWYAFETEFRYVLEPGEVVAGSGRIPVGQVFAVPRHELELREASSEEAEAFRTDQAEFLMSKMPLKQTNAMGLQYDTVYREAARRTAT